MSQNVTDRFVDYLLKKKNEVSFAAMEKANACREDYFAVVIAGAAKNRSRWSRLIKQDGKAEVFGYDLCTDSRTAALINGFNAHSLELDDGHRFAMIHLGAAVISAIEAAASDFCIAEEERRIGIVMGYEAACRIAIAIQPSHKQLGFHAAGTCGTIGAAIGTAFALGMEKKELKCVLTAAAASSAGLLEIQEQKSEMKPFNLGRAAMDGLNAAYMGMTGFETPDDILGGERGFCRLYANEFSEEHLLEERTYFEIERIYVKLYASCRHSHSAAEAAIRLHDKVNPEDINEVTVRTYRLGVKGHDHTQIAGTASAKLSTPYAVAAGLIYGKADLTVFEPIDDKIIQLAGKVKVVEDSELTKLSPEKRVAIVTVTAKDGMMYTERVDYAKGDPENPLTPSEISEKRNALQRYSEILMEEYDEQHG